MESTKKKLNKHDLIVQIHEKCPDIKMKDIQSVIEVEQDVVVDNLSKGNNIKWGKLFIFKSEIKEPRKHYDGLHKKVIELPKRQVIKVEQLSRIENIYKAIN